MLGILAAALLSAPPAGTLLILGGGRESDAAFRRLVELADGPIAVLAQSRQEPAGSAMALREALLGAGAKEVRAPAGTDPADALRALEGARGVYLSGGDQTLFASRFPESSGIPEAIRAVLKRGGVVGGTSAGASLVGEWMPTGEGETPDALAEDPKAVMPGLNLWPGAIVDQHFLARRRWTRLVAAGFQIPARWALGVEERAWVEVTDGSVEAFEGPAILLRGIQREGEGQNLGGRAELIVLQPGRRVRL